MNSVRLFVVLGTKSYFRRGKIKNKNTHTHKILRKFELVDRQTNKQTKKNKKIKLRLLRKKIHVFSYFIGKHIEEKKIPTDFLN